MAKRAMSSEKASKVKRRGHEREREFARLMGIEESYENDKKAKKDVIDFNGDGHSVKGGKWWQIFLYSPNRIQKDYGFLAMNGIGELILDCLNVFPPSRAEYLTDKNRYKIALQTPMRELKERLCEKNRLKAFLSKAIFNGGEVQFLTVFVKDDAEICIFYFEDVVETLAQYLTVQNSGAKRAGEFEAQKVLFKLNGVNVGEIEVRNDSDIHYREIKFRFNAQKITHLLCEKIFDYDCPNAINGVPNERILRFGKAMKRFKV